MIPCKLPLDQNYNYKRASVLMFGYYLTCNVNIFMFSRFMFTLGGWRIWLENLIDDDNTTCTAIPCTDVFKELKLNFTCVNSITETSPVDQKQIKVNLKTQDPINCDETLKLYCKHRLKNPDCSSRVVRKCHEEHWENSNCNFSCTCNNDNDLGSLFLAPKNYSVPHNLMNILICDLNVYLDGT